LSQESADGVKKVGLMMEHGQCKGSAEASEEPCGGNAEIKEVVKVIAAIIQLCLESPEADTFSHSRRSIEYGNTPGFQPEVKRVNKFPLSRGIKHPGGPHVLGKRDLGKPEVGF
jgi:hypothetical protein